MVPLVMAVAPSDLSPFDGVARISDSKAPYPTVTEAVICISSLSSLPTDEQGIKKKHPYRLILGTTRVPSMLPLFASAIA